ncbi:DUF6710 family protein [Paenibacillus sp. FSL E2-0190]|uniref:DUF6710 family protein n=1 Tax=Paenibacillus sp. FSL E2-0190 TaxID=2954504 RepID=UPI0030EBB477
MWKTKRTKVDKAKIEKENKQRRDLKHILMTAQRIISQTTTYKETHPIYLLIKQLVDLELHRNIYNSISTHEPNRVEDFNNFYLLPYNYKSDKVYNLISSKRREKDYLYINEHDRYVSYDLLLIESKIEGKTASIKLGFDPILTRPWNEDKLVRAISNIGSGKPCGEWIEDSNHDADLWLPFGITFVNNGNHSITTGVLNNEGSLNVTSIYDISKIFPHIYCDGVNYFRSKDNSLYAPVRNFSLAAIFEIGRLIKRNDFSGEKIKFRDLTNHSYT